MARNVSRMVGMSALLLLPLLYGIATAASYPSDDQYSLRNHYRITRGSAGHEILPNVSTDDYEDDIEERNREAVSLAELLHLWEPQNPEDEKRPQRGDIEVTTKGVERGDVPVIGKKKKFVKRQAPADMWGFAEDDGLLPSDEDVRPTPHPHRKHHRNSGLVETKGNDSPLRWRGPEEEMRQRPGLKDRRRFYSQPNDGQRYDEDARRPYEMRRTSEEEQRNENRPPTESGPGNANELRRRQEAAAYELRRQQEEQQRRENPRQNNNDGRSTPYNREDENRRRQEEERRRVYEARRREEEQRQNDNGRRRPGDNGQEDPRQRELEEEQRRRFYEMKRRTEMDRRQQSGESQQENPRQRQEDEERRRAHDAKRQEEEQSQSDNGRKQPVNNPQENDERRRAYEERRREEDQRRNDHGRKQPARNPQDDDERRRAYDERRREEEQPRNDHGRKQPANNSQEDDERRRAYDARRREDEQKQHGSPSDAADTYEKRMQEWRKKKEEHDRLVKEREQQRNQPRPVVPLRPEAQTKSSGEDEENERKLQDYIRRNTPINVASTNSPRVPASDRIRENDQVRRAEHERRLEEERRRKQVEEESRRLAEEERTRRTQERENAGGVKTKQRGTSPVRPRWPINTNSTNTRTPVENYSSGRQPIPQNRPEENDPRYLESRRNEAAASNSRRPSSDTRKKDEENEEERLKKLNGLPVSATIIVRSSDTDANRSSTSPPAPFQLQPRFGDEEGDIDFPGLGPARSGPVAAVFPAPATKRPPIESPPACTWAIVVCCQQHRQQTRNQALKITRCFEATNCPGAGWDVDRRCSVNNVRSANDEIRQFYVKGQERNY